MSTKKAPIKYKSASPRVRILHIAANMLRPHTLLGRVGLLPEMIQREDAKGKKAGKNREDHKELAQELGSEFEALKTSIRNQGIIEPLKVVREAGGWAIADGRNRWEASRALDEKAKIPCVEVSEDAARGVILAAMARRHMSKQARALMAVKVFPEVVEEAAAGRQFRNHCGINQTELAAQVGVSERTMVDACHFWRAIALNPKAREERMNQVFAGVSFERVLQGETGAKKSVGKSREDSAPVNLLLRNANSLKLHWPKWETFTPKAQIQVTERLVEAMRAAPQDVREAIESAWNGGEA